MGKKYKDRQYKDRMIDTQLNMKSWFKTVCWPKIMSSNWVLYLQAKQVVKKCLSYSLTYIVLNHENIFEFIISKGIIRPRQAVYNCLVY